MTFLHTWLGKPRATVRVDTTVPWGAWMKALRRPFTGKQDDMRARIEVLDRLPLGGKKSLLLISIDGHRLLVGVGEDAAPSISALETVRTQASSRLTSRTRQTSRGTRRVR